MSSCLKDCLVFQILCFCILIRNNSLVYCQGIQKSHENAKYVVGNSTTLSGDISRIDRSHHDEEIETKFIIMSNLIIRTRESRVRGAKYLNETRLSSNHECLIWCLETPTCNTAVYEEKNMQSCYLFDCGSPAKPLCKFTGHHFFTSSFLKMTQHSYELSQWGRQVQEERGNTERHSVISTTTPMPVGINVISTTSVLPPSNIQPTKKGSVCHHYQFQCQNSSECIAIYNVCDGIPQCPDESDESPELKCPNKDASKEILSGINRIADIPPTLANKAPPMKQELQGPPPARPSAGFNGMQNAPSHKKTSEHKEIQHKEFKGMWPSSYSGPPKTKMGYHHHRVDDSDGLGSPFNHKHSQFLSANDPHVESLNQWANDYDQYPPHSTSAEQQYNPYDRIEEQYLSNQMSPDYDTGKNYGYHQDDIPYWPSQDILQDSSYTDEFPQPRSQNMNKGMSYPDKENLYEQQMSRTAEQYPEEKLSIHSKPLLSQNQPSDIDDYKLRRYPHSRPQKPYLSLEDSLPERYYSDLKAKNFNPLQSDDETLYSNDDLIRASLAKQMPSKIDFHHPQGHDLKHLDKDMLRPASKEKHINKSTESPKDNSLIIVKPTAPIKSIQRTVLDFKMSVAELYQSSTTHTHETNSAILALVLGVIVSVFLVILLACRMKTLRRRMSRKGRGLTHDADYLVNGMYL